MPPAAVKSSGVVVPQPVKWHGRLAARLICLVGNTVAATLRMTVRDDSGMFMGAPPEPVIWCMWHNRLALSLILYRDFVQARQPSRRLAGLVSASKDGGILARVVELFGAEAVRGSSSRRGAQALLELTSCMERGCDVAITPDGPRGPRYLVQPGVVTLAQLTGRAVVPVSYHTSWKKSLRSWDGFQLPLPFARCELVFGEPVRIPRKATEAERETLRALLEDRLKAITRD